MTLYEKTVRRDSNTNKYDSLQEAYMKVLNEGKFKKGDKVKVIDKDDDYYGKVGKVHRVGNQAQTVNFGKSVVSFNDDQLQKV